DMVWLSLIGDKYSPLPNGITAASILDPNNGVLKAIKGVKSPEYAGSERINGVDTTIISGTIDAGDLTALDTQAQAGKPVKGRVWIGNADQRVYRLRIEGPLNDTEPANIARQIDFSQFDETLSIQPPA
ncbi:MAG: LppX_LprAFG lipoprotein, partial [Dehalococcoidia bacterium]